MGMMETVIEIPTEHEQNVFGQFDVYAKKIESQRRWDKKNTSMRSVSR